MSDSESSDEENPLAFIQNKPSLPKGFTIPKGRSSKPPPTNITNCKQLVSTHPIPSKTEVSRKRPLSKGEDLVPSAWSSAYDKELPEELLSKCGENKCDICNATLGSKEVARSHYAAKTHEKKVNLFLENLFKDSGEAPPKRVRSWETGPTYNRGSAEVTNLICSARAPGNSNTLGGFRNKTFQRRWLDLWDGPLPTDLVNMCGASRCGLCEVDISSLNVATAHYEGKPHAKKVREFCIKVGAEVPRRKDEKQEVKEKFCELCKVELTSAVMAKAHYSGKEHLRREATGKEKIKVVEDKTGRFGIGGNFKTNTGYKPEGEDDVVGEELTWGAMAKVAELQPKFHCNVCNISLESQTVFQTHLQGKNHRKKENQQTGSNIGNQSSGSSGNIGIKKDVPGGSVNLRCDICDISVNSQEILNAHLQGKNHKKKLNQVGGSNGNSVKSFHCDVCNVNTSDQTNLDMHLQGAKHNKMLRNMGLPSGALFEMNASNKLKNN